MDWVQSKFTDFCVPAQPKKKQRLDHNFKKRNKTKTVTPDKSLSWVDKYQPKLKSELVVHKKKIEEIEVWLKNIGKSDSSTNILLLIGPPGCGKYTTIEVLCKHINIGISEWITPPPQVFDEHMVIPYTNQQKSFEDFIIRVSRYSSLIKQSNERLVVVKDIPNVFIKDKNLFHENLIKYSLLKDIHIVFILHEENVNNDLFPEDVKSKCNITTISFNPITKKSVSTVLSGIMQKSSFTVTSSIKQFINDISNVCNGDLRNAINSMNFLVINGTNQNANKNVTKQEQSEICSQICNDNSINIFHGIGRVLYAKRNDKGMLTHNPSEVASTFEDCSHLFIGMLQENYLSVFSDIHSARKAANILSTSDYFIQDLKDFQLSKETALNVTVRGLMINNISPIKRFQNFGKSKSKKASDLYLSYKNSLEANFPTSNVSNILLDSVTYLNTLSLTTQSQKKLISELCTFNLMKIY